MVIGICTIPVQESRTFLHNQKATVLLTLFHALAVLVDILITLGLTFTLRKSQTSFANTRSLLQRLVIYIASRGILITAVQVGHIIMYLVNPSNLLFWLSIHLTLSKLYVISTLATLNHRESLRDDEAVVVDRLRFSVSKPVDSITGDTESGIVVRPSLEETREIAT
ncbi:hypothetical protein DXG01_013061 [Tephrocybe rancida]|nr:hypothetical protein DXG01_013061 [Tephrocybe rancida]